MPNTDADPVLRVEDLVKRYPGRPVNAVDGISFTVGRGEMFGLLGPNGAGKSTTIGVLTTRVRPTSGRVEIAGLNVAKQAVETKRRIAVVPQRNNLDRSLTARQNLLFHAAYFGMQKAVREARADELLEQFGLTERAHEKVDRYSGGMAQRLMIARALMHRPDVLFLDEPTTGLDPQSRLFVWDRVRELNREGLSVVLTTHDMDEAESLCHRIAIVDHGHLLALDTPAALKHLVPGARALELQLVFDEAEVEQQVTPFIDTLSTLEGVHRVERGQPEGGDSRPGDVLLHVYADQVSGLVVRVAETASEAGADIKDLRSSEVTLESVFIHLTGRGLR